MAKIPKEVIGLLDDPQTHIVLGFVDAEGAPNVLQKGRLHVVDEETIAFADLAFIKIKTDFKANDKAAIVAFKERFGYQIKGTFQEYHTSGALFDQWAKNVDVARLGLIKVDEVYSFLQGDYGKKIA